MIVASRVTIFIFNSGRLITVERLRLRLQICLNLTPVSISDWLLITYKLKYSNFKVFESILGIVTTLTSEKYWYFTLLKTCHEFVCSAFIIFYQWWMYRIAIQESF